MVLPKVYRGPQDRPPIDLIAPANHANEHVHDIKRSVGITSDSIHSRPSLVHPSVVISNRRPILPILSHGMPQSTTFDIPSIQATPASFLSYRATLGQSWNWEVGYLLSESRRATTHDLALANQLSIEFGTVEREIDVEINSVECALRCVHALEVFLQILAAEIGSEGDDFLYACCEISVPALLQLQGYLDLRGSFVYSGHTSSSQA